MKLQILHNLSAFFSKTRRELKEDRTPVDTVTTDKLELQKLELELVAFKIHTVIDHCLESLMAKADSRKVQIFKSGVNFAVVADQARISQVVSQLVTNAISHSPDCGIVAVQTSGMADCLKVAVIDHGQGMAKSEQKTIFEQDQGSELNLAICKLIIEAHHGTIGLNSAAGQGAEFWFTLPNDGDQ